MGKALGRATGAASRVGVSPSASSGGRRVEEYAIAHQTGTARVPQRRYLGVSQDDAKAVEAVIQRIMARAERGVLAGLAPGGIAATLTTRPILGR